MATDYFLHPLNGNNANPGTEGSPKQYFDSAFRSGLVAGDRVFWHRAYDNPIVSSAGQYLAAKAGSVGNPVYYGAWGVGQKRYATLYKPGAYDDFILNGGGVQARYTVWEDICFDCRNEVSKSLYLYTQTSNQTQDIVMRRCGAIRSLGSGFAIGIEGSATAEPPMGLILEDVFAWDNAVHGIFIQGYNHRILRPDCARNGATGAYGGHGVSLGAAKTDLAASGWTLVGGNIYSRSVASNHSGLVFAMRFDGFSNQIAQYTGGTPNTSTPANQFAISGTTLYANLNGANPNSYTSTYAWRRTYGNLVAGGRLYGNRWNRSAPYHEGHGAACDDWADSNFIIGNEVYDNQGLGLSNNRGASNFWYGNVVMRNWQAGLSANPSASLRIINNTFLGNNIGEGAFAAEINLFAGSASALISNNIVVCDGLGGNTYGVDVDPADSGHGGATNYIYGADTPTRSGTFTGTQYLDPRPYLNADGSLKVPYLLDDIPILNPLGRAGTYVQGVVLRNGRTIPGQVPIGAYAEGRY